jgi:hypothetical protein
MASSARAAGHARHHPAKPVQPAWTWATIVPACAEWARRYDAQYDAYWDAATGIVNTWGVLEGRAVYEFEKCMRLHGFAIKQHEQQAAAVTTTTLPPQVVWRIAWRLKPGNADRTWKWLSDGPFESRYACEEHIATMFRNDGWSPSEAKSALNDFQCFTATE